MDEYALVFELQAQVMFLKEKLQRMQTVKEIIGLKEQGLLSKEDSVNEIIRLNGKLNKVIEESNRMKKLYSEQMASLRAQSLFEVTAMQEENNRLRKQLGNYVPSALNKNVSDKEIVRMRADGRTIREISKATGMSIGGIQYRVNKLRKQGQIIEFNGFDTKNSKE